MRMLSASKSQKANGSLPHPCKSWSNALVPPPPTPSATFARISVTMAYTAQCTPVQPVTKPHQVMLPIIVWRPSVVSVIDGDTLTKSVTFESVEDAMPRDMWSITAQSIHLPNQTLEALMVGVCRTYSDNNDLNTLVDDN